MDQNPRSMSSDSQSSSNMAMWMVLSILLTALVVGGGVYMMQQSSLQKSEDKLQSQITLLNSQIASLKTETVKNDAPIQKETNTTTSEKVTYTFFTKTEGNSVVLYRLGSDGVETKTGLSVTKDWPSSYVVTVNVVVSPDQQYAVYEKWVGVEMVLYVANIDGSSAKKIADQEVVEGSGELDTSSIAWVDNSTVRYIETGAGGSKTYEVNTSTLQKRTVK